MTLDVAPWTRFPTNECRTVTVRATDDAGVLVPAPIGGLAVSFDVLRIDGGAISVFSWATRTACPSTGYDLVLPKTVVIPVGASSATFGVEQRTSGDALSRLRVTRPGLQPADVPVVVPPSSISDDLALLPFFAVSSTGQVSFRAYALWVHTESSGGQFIGFLNTTAPITHVIRPALGPSTPALVFNNGVANPLTGVVSPLPVSSVDAVSRLRNDRVVTFSAALNQVTFNVLQVSPLGAGIVASDSPMAPVQANSNAGGSVAVALAPTARSFGQEDPFGTKTIWFTSRGRSVPMVIGSIQYQFSGGPETFSGLATQETSLPLSAGTAHNGMSLGSQTVFFTVGQNRGGALLPPAMAGQYPTSYPPVPSLGTGVNADGPENFAHVSLTPNTIAFIARPSSPGARQYDFVQYDVADAGVRVLRTMYPDQQTTDPFAITTPTLARGCVVNTRWGVTFFYSTRANGSRTYQHWAQPYRSNPAGTPGTETPVEIPGMEDAVISCGGSRLFHIDLWPY